MAVPASPAASPLGGVTADTLVWTEATDGRVAALPGVHTGFTDLDFPTGGLHPGRLIVLAACPAMAKSTLALDFVCSAGVQHSRPSVAYTFDAERNEAGMRVLSAEAASSCTAYSPA